MGEINRRVFLGTVGLVGLTPLLASCVSLTPAPTMAAAAPTLAGLWDAVVPGTYRGTIEAIGPGAEQAGVQEWIEDVVGSLPSPFNYISDWFLRAWADDLDLWADVFHPPFGDGPRFGDLPLGPSLTERGRQYKLMLMTGLFDGIIELQYFGAITLAKLAFYCDFRAETAGTPRVGGPYIGFPGAIGYRQPEAFSYRREAGRPDDRLTRSPDGLVVVP